MHVAKASSKLSMLKPKMGACIVKSGKVLAVGYNRPGSTKWTLYSRHAEVTAIIAAGNCRGATMFVYREHAKTGKILMAKPCSGCSEAILLAGIRRVVYTTSDGVTTYRA